jgi:hypothetical protein
MTTPPQTPMADVGEQMGQHGMDTFQKRLLPLPFGMLMYEGDPAVMRRTLSNVPLPARLMMPIIAPRVLAATLGGSTAPRLRPRSRRSQTPQPRGWRMRHLMRRNHAR